MLLTIATAHRPATDLGYLLHKNPARPQAVDIGFGRAQVVYPEAGDDVCRVALVVDVDPVALVRRRGRDGERARRPPPVTPCPEVCSRARRFPSARATTSSAGRATPA